MIIGGIEVVSLTLLFATRYAPPLGKIPLTDILSFSVINSYETVLKRYEVSIEFRDADNQRIRQSILMHKFEFWDLRDRLAVAINSVETD